MNILITGGAGFMGSHFIRYMFEHYRNIQVANLDKLTYAASIDRVKDIEKRFANEYHFLKGDITDQAVVEEVFKKFKPDIVVDFAAETHVDRSILEPGSFVRTDVIGTYTLLEAARKFGVKRFVKVSCYDEATRALTPQGLKTYRELKEGDLVFSLNPNTLEIELKPIEKVIVQHFSGKMSHFSGRRVDIAVTQNHQMFILGPRRKKLLIETANKTSQRSIFYMPKGHWIGKDEKFIHIKDYGNVKTEDIFYILGIFIGDGFTAYQEKIIKTKSGLMKQDYLTRARDLQSGKFTHIEKQSDYASISHGYRIFFDIPENDKCRGKVEETLSRLGIKHNSHKGKAGTHLYFTSKPFMEFFSQCGRGAYNKHIPRWILEYSPECLKHLFEGLIDSDGHRGNVYVYHSVSKQLVSNICELAIKLGLQPRIHKRYSHSFIDGRKIEGGSYYVTIARTMKSVKKSMHKIIDYNGIIWCLKVKDNKNFLIERNGRFDFCGNTDEVFGSIEKGKFTEESSFKPNSPYSASKAGGDLLCRAYFNTYRLPVIVTHFCNFYGPWQHPEKFIPLFITNLIEGKKAPLYGNGRNQREWIYVDDVCGALSLLLQKGKVGEAYNIGSGSEKENWEVATHILRILGKDASFIVKTQDRPGHDARYALSSSKIKKLGFAPRFSFERGLKETIEWYKTNKQWWEKIKQSEEFREYYTKQYPNF